jgi:hypothetical protein
MKYILSHKLLNERKKEKIRKREEGKGKGRKEESNIVMHNLKATKRQCPIVD